MMIRRILHRLHDFAAAQRAHTLRALVLPATVVLSAVTFVGNPQTAGAHCTACRCITTEHIITRQLISDQHNETRLHITEEFNDWELFMIDVMWREYFLPAMMLFSQQMTAVAMEQMWIVGEFLDAKQQLETQRLLQRMVAEAHKDYQPSVGMCVFGTVTRSLAAAERRSETTAFILSQRAQDREVGQMNASGAEGPQQDKFDRLALMIARYCKKTDNYDGLDTLCTTKPPNLTTNRDVDYTRLIDRPLTLELDLTDGQPPTDDEIDLFALHNNLYAHDVFRRFPESLFRDNVVQNQQRLIEARALTAKRAVAENSFNIIAGMRAMGSPDPGGSPPPGSSVDTAKYLTVILNQLGLTNATEIQQLIGERPSYNAQMEVLTKKMYQRPEFYTELYDTPANVQRKTVAMQAIGLMQDFDTLKSYMRQEMILSLIVELELQQQQGEVVDALGGLTHEGLMITDTEADP